MADCQTDLHRIKLDHFFRKSLVLQEVFIQLSSSNKWHYEIYSLFGLEDKIHAYQKWMSAFEQNITFEFGGLNLVGFNENILSNGFYGVELFRLLQDGEVDLSKGPFPQDGFDFEVFKG